MLDRRGGEAAPTDDLSVATPGGALFVRIWGGRERCRAVPPILLFHDSLGSVELWREFPAALAQSTGRPVIAYDRLGFGRSDPHPGVLPFAFVRDEAHSSVPALRTALEIDRMVLFGHSVGGAMAVVTAARFAESTVSVITESAQSFVEERTLAAIRAAKVSFEAPGQVERLVRYHGDKAAWVLNAWTESWLRPRFATLVLDNYLRRLRCPVLAIHGDRDEFGSLAQPRRIAALAATHTETVILEDTGHVPHREKPDLVLRAVSTFLDTGAAA
jgi:pimeloyl-ACP methyl ester carboxylesterase